jgi:hypothetical protein
LIGEIALAKELNLDKSTWTDIPKDFYTFVGFKVKEFLISILNDPTAELSEEEKVSYKKLSQLNLIRSLIKQAIMTIPYNASALTIVDYMKESFEAVSNPDYKKESKIDTNSSSGVKDKKNKKTKVKSLLENQYYVFRLKSDPSIVFTELDFQSLRKALNIVIFVDYPKLSALLDYLKTIADISNTLNIPIPWILPTGLVVKQQFFAKETIKVKPFNYTKNLLNLTVTRKDKLNIRKQKTALATPA